MTRYNKWNYICQNFIISKSNSYLIQNTPLVENIVFTTGHYQLNNLFTEHGLIFKDLSLQSPLISLHVHGKRRRLTATLRTNINQKNCWFFIDKLVNITFPAIGEFRAIKVKKVSKDSSYICYFRKYFDYHDSTSFVSDRTIAKTDVFSPITIKFNINKYVPSYINETYLRMLRIPFLFIT